MMNYPTFNSSISNKQTPQQPQFPFNQAIISDIKDLEQLIQQYPNERVIPQFKQLKKQYPNYRAVRGDGNCFYRAFAFLYLRQADFRSYDTVFDRSVKNQCQGHSIYFEDRRNMQGQLLRLFAKHLKPLQKASNHIRQKSLMKCFNHDVLFDKLLIMYFRSINYTYFKESSSDFRDKDMQDQIAQKIKRFGQESQAQEVYSLGFLYKSQVKIMITDQISVRSQIYHQELRDRQFVLFFRPGHYDILYSKYSTYLQMDSALNTERQNYQQQQQEYFQKSYSPFSSRLTTNKQYQNSKILENKQYNQNHRHFPDYSYEPSQPRSGSHLQQSQQKYQNSYQKTSKSSIQESPFSKLKSLRSPKHQYHPFFVSSTQPQNQLSRFTTTSVNRSNREKRPHLVEENPFQKPKLRTQTSYKAWDGSADETTVSNKLREMSVVGLIILVIMSILLYV